MHRRLVPLLLAACTQDVHVAGPGTPADSDAPPVDTAPAPASLPVYAHTPDALYAVDPDTGATVRLGPFADAGGRVVQMADLAIDLDGRLYAGAHEARAGTYTVYRVDPDTGRIASACESPVPLTAMAFLSDGRLIVGSGRRLVALDVGAGCADTLLLDHPEFVTSGDVVGLPDGLLYWTLASGFEDRLAVVDPADPQGARVVGTLARDRIFGLGYDEAEGALYGFSDDGEILRIDPATAESTVLAVSETLVWWGATTNPVLWR